MRVGIVCEGRTDFILLEQVVLSVFGPCTVDPIQPTRDALDESRWGVAGWTLVRRWCERGPTDIADDMLIGSIDVLVVHVDGDLVDIEELPDTRVTLCHHIQSQWMGEAPPGVLICIPARTTDTWLVAALDPEVSDPESEMEPLEHLVRLGVLRPAPVAEREPRKNQYAYRQHAPTLGSSVERLRPILPELDRFVGKLRRFVP